MKKGLLYFLTIFGFVFAVGILLAPQIAKAITYCAGSEPEDDPDAYDPTTDIDVDTGSVPAALKKFLLDSGYNETAASGIMGNIAIESCGYKLRVYNNSCSSFAPDDFVAYKDGQKTFSGGYGLVQWTSNGRVKGLQDYADELGLSVNTLKVQAGYLVKELKSNSYKLLPSKLNSMTLAEVVWIIMRDYETPESVICTSSCKNQSSARNISLATLLNNKTTYQTAYNAYNNRLSEAKSAQSVTTTTGDDPDPVDPTGGEEPQTPTGTTTGALGKQSSSGFYSQGRASYSGEWWRKNDQGYPDTTISASGCSLIAVANSAKYLGLSTHDPSTLATYGRSHISGSGQTGWGPNMSVGILMNYVGAKQKGSWLWSSYATSTSAKIQKIRETLASGGVVLAGGDRNRSSNPNRQSIDCTSSSNINAGLCVFSNNGHFITIVGITSDDKLIVANPANGKNGSSASDKLNATNVLKFSNKAIGVYK